jgi:hypothetical protein
MLSGKHSTDAAMSREENISRAKERIAKHQALLKPLESGKIQIGKGTQAQIDDLKRKIAEDRLIVDRDRDNNAPRT